MTSEIKVLEELTVNTSLHEQHHSIVKITFNYHLNRLRFLKLFVYCLDRQT